MLIPDPVLSRRTVLTVGAASVGIVALAACGSDSTKKAADPSGPGSSSGTSSTSQKGGSSGSADGGAADRLVALDSITVGEAVAASLSDGSKVIVARPTATTAACFSAICTHQGCTVAPAGKQLHCPCHGSIYNAVTGAVIQGPAPRPLPKVPVKVADGQVVSAG
jgi:cytochrome b6-f complex iron-sulfur subunit